MTNVKKYRDLGRMRPDKLCPGTWARSEYVLHISRCVQRQCVTSPVDFGPSLINYPRFTIMDRIDSGRMRYRRDLGQELGRYNEFRRYVTSFHFFKRDVTRKVQSGK